MSWIILVEWLGEGERTVVPTSWVVSPENPKLPVDGEALWKKKKYDARLLETSDKLSLFLLALHDYSSDPYATIID